MDEYDQCKKEAGLFLEQDDNEILVSERPERYADIVIGPGARSQEQGKSYLLNRFISDSRFVEGRRGESSQANIKSMQHFFLKVCADCCECLLSEFLLIRNSKLAAKLLLA